jgi:IS5 family transposase
VAWLCLAGSKTTNGTSVASNALGKTLDAKHCAPCHGVGLEGQRDWKSPAALRTDAGAAARCIRSHLAPPGRSAHADIIVKGSRDVDYGHKLNLTTGKSGLILDLVVETGNPADSERFLPMLERHIAFYGEPPRQAAADGGYASRANLRGAKACGVRDMAFHKKCGLSIEDMVTNR